jgi:hypothetical protein
MNVGVYVGGTNWVIGAHVGGAMVVVIHDGMNVGVYVGGLYWVIGAQVGFGCSTTVEITGTGGRVKVTVSVMTGDLVIGTVVGYQTGVGTPGGR